MQIEFAVCFSSHTTALRDLESSASLATVGAPNDTKRRAVKPVEHSKWSEKGPEASVPREGKMPSDCNNDNCKYQETKE